MSSEKSDQDSFQLIWLGNPSETALQLTFTKQFTDYVQFKEYMTDKKSSSIILVLSNGISVEATTLIDLPQICAIYNEKLVCLYCLPEMVSVLDTFMKREQQEKPKQSTIRICSSSVLPTVRKYWFLIGLTLVICLAYAFPNVGKTGGYIRSEWTVKWGCIILIFFLSGLSLRTKLLAKELLHIRLHATVQIVSLLIIPFTVFAFGLLLTKLAINKTLIAGIIIMACTSTTISSNVVMTKNSMGNEYAALVNAVVGNLLGIFVSPALVFYFMKNPTFDFLSKTVSGADRLNYGSVIKSLCLTVLVPLFIGQVIQLIWTKQVAHIREKFYFSEVNSLALLTVVWSVFCTAIATGSFRTVSGKDLGLLILIDGGIYIVFSLLILITARIPIQKWQFSREDTVAMMFCGATKTLAMGIPLINALYANRDQKLIGLISLPLIMYHVEQLILGAIEVMWLKSWVKRGLKEQSATMKDNANVRRHDAAESEIGELETINVKR